MPQVFFRSRYLLKNHETNTGEKVCLQTLFFHNVSFHLYSLPQTRNKCVYALSVAYRVVFLFVSGLK
jgi:hypothetical protein